LGAKTEGGGGGGGGGGIECLISPFVLETA